MVNVANFLQDFPVLFKIHTLVNLHSYILYISVQNMNINAVVNQYQSSRK